MKAELSSRAAELIRDHVEPDVGDAAHADARMRFVAAASGRSGDKRNWRRPAFALAAVVAVVACVLAWRSLSPGQPLAFSAGQSPGKLGAYIVGVGSTPLRFSDGSVVTLEQGARARVASTNSDGASVQIESGTIHAHVVHRAHTKWHFAAGPYDVRVTGTEFTLSWDPRGVLEIVMQSGAVVVRGPGAEPGVVVRDRQRFTSEAHSRLEPAPSAGAASKPSPAPAVQGSGSVPPPADSTQPANGASSVAAPPGSAPTRSGRSAASSATTSPPASLSRLVAKGDYKQVLALARRRGIGSVLAGGSVGDVAAVADAARYTGDRALARRALLKLRARFPASVRGVSAAFLLGRMADEGGNPAQALRWYDTYLKQAPGGGLAAEALGRRMLALKHLGDAAQSQGAARDYLKRFPNGPYAGVAREILAP